MSATVERTTTPARPPRRPRRKPLRRFLIVSHRWLSLVLGLVLLVITTSGAVVLYRPEIERSLDQDAYAASGKPARTSLAQAMAVVKEEHPSFGATSVWFEHGVYAVTDDETKWTVDPATGEILGRAGPTPTWLQWTDNLHECFLSCEGEPGTLGFLTQEVPGSTWAGFEGAQVTWGGLVLGLTGLLLLYLSLTGIWLWFPRPQQWRSSMDVRWKRGRFARDTDLHKVAGMIVIPFLLMWAVTGAGYELGFVEKGWYAALPGSEKEAPEAVSKEAKGPDVTVIEATRAAQALHPDDTMVSIALPAPAKDDPTSGYYFYFADGFDPYGQTQYPGDLGVFVDRHTGEARDFYGQAGRSVTQQLWEEWNYPVHSGYVVNGWWRSIWMLFALSPLLLTVTGISTWLVRRGTRRRRHAAAKAGQVAPPLPDALAEELVADPESAPDLAEAAAESSAESSAEPSDEVSR